MGNVTLNVSLHFASLTGSKDCCPFQGVRRQIIGCNDGTDEPVPNGEEFLEIGDETSGLGERPYISLNAV